MLIELESLWRGRHQLGSISRLAYHRCPKIRAKLR